MAATDPIQLGDSLFVVRNGKGGANELVPVSLLPTAGALILLSQSVVPAGGATTLSATGLPQAAGDLVIVGSFVGKRTDNATDTLVWRTSNGSADFFTSNPGDVGAVAAIPTLGSGVSNSPLAFEATIYSYANLAAHTAEFPLLAVKYEASGLVSGTWTEAGRKGIARSAAYGSGGGIEGVTFATSSGQGFAAGSLLRVYRRGPN